MHFRNQITTSPKIMGSNKKFASNSVNRFFFIWKIIKQINAIVNFISFMNAVFNWEIFSEKVGKFDCFPLRKKCPYSELFWSAFFPYFPAFGLNKERYNISPYSVQIWENAGKMRTRIIPNTDTFYAVSYMLKKYATNSRFSMLSY